MNEESNIDDDELIECPNCSGKFNKQELEDNGYEFNKAYPKCSDCQDKEQAMIESKNCEHCDSQAEFMANGLYLCSDHHDPYLK